MRPEDMMPKYDEDSNLHLRFGHIDPLKYDFETCRTRVDPLGPFYQDDVFAALMYHEGHVSDAAKLLGRPRNNLERWLNSNHDFMHIKRDIIEGNIDTLEQRVMHSALNGDTADRRFLLTTLGKRRGYTTRQEVVGKDGAAVEFEAVFGERMSSEQLTRISNELAEAAKNA